jgi:hypothetical protein
VADGIILYHQGRYDDATEQLETCPDLTRAMRWIGLSLYESGKTELAKAVLEQSVELTPMGRCRPSLNRVVREVAEEYDHVHLVDLESAAQRSSPAGVPGSELFVDNCHMTWEGYALMGEEVRRVLEQTGVGPSWPVEAPPLGLDEMGERLGLPPRSGGSGDRSP